MSSSSKKDKKRVSSKKDRDSSKSRKSSSKSDGSKKTSKRKDDGKKPKKKDRSKSKKPAAHTKPDAKIPSSLQNEEDMLAKYELDDEQLGAGAFSVVKLARDRETGEKVAVKVISKKEVSDKFIKNLSREIAIMKEVDHPNIVKLLDMYDTGDKFYFVMELVTGGELFERIVEKGHYTEEDAKTLSKRILRGVAYLHERGIAHRDLKPENLLLKSKENDYDVKIADFGLSSFISSKSLMQTACGTPAYVAPEVLKDTGYGSEVDLWSVGVITYILLVGFPPFHAESVRGILQVVLKGHFDFPSPYWDDITPHARDFIRKLLVVDPEDRLTAKEALDHPWIKSTGSTIQLKGFQSQMSKYILDKNAKRAEMGSGRSI